MSRNRRNQRFAWLLAALGLVLALAGCGTGNDEAAFGAGGQGGSGAPSGDGGLGGAGAPEFDAVEGLEGNPVDQLFADPARGAADFPAAGGAGARDYAEAAAACYYAADACGGAGCEAFASCCVDTGSCCRPVDDAPLPAALDFESCAEASVGACAASDGSSADSFGELSPVVTDRGLVPNGTATSEGGAVIGETVNLFSQRVVVDTQFALPIGCGSTCLQSAGVAFTASEPGTFVDADVGLLLSGSRREVTLLIGDGVADAYDAGSDATQWRLILSPRGTVEVFRDDVLLGAYPFDAAGLTEAKLVVFGRNLGDAADSAAVSKLEVEVATCDNPRAWEARAPLTVTFESSPVPRHSFGNAPSMAEHEGSTLVAYEVEGEVFVATAAALTIVELAALAPALLPGEPFEARGIGDPELVSTGSSLLLFYTARDAGGAASVALASSPSGPDAFVKNGPTLAPSGDVASFDAPTVVLRDGLFLMVVRATLDGGATELQAYYTSDPSTGWARVVDGGLEELSAVSDPAMAIGSPSLIIHNSAYQLYYARRMGTRWSVELAVSDELLLWRPMGRVLGPGEQSFDSLGARSPDAISRPDRIELLYSGQNGVTFQLGVAVRAAPSDTAPSIF